jgi:broad specificity phosphatase PhoE
VKSAFVVIARSSGAWLSGPPVGPFAPTLPTDAPATITGVEVVLVRHGETEWSLDGRHTGVTDIPLTEHGRHQAEHLRDALAGRDFELVLTSPLERAMETCRLAGLGDQAERTTALLEWDYGEYEGITTKTIRESRPDWYLWRDGCPGGETAAEVGARLDPLVGRLASLGGDAALFAHGHVLRVLTARWLELGPESGALFALGTATLSTLGFERETRVITRWNAPVAAAPSESRASPS